MAKLSAKDHENEIREFHAKFDQKSDKEKAIFQATAVESLQGAYWSYDTDIQNRVGMSYEDFKKHIEEIGATDSIYSFDLKPQEGAKTTPGLVSSMSLEISAAQLVGLLPGYDEEMYKRSQRYREETMAALERYCLNKQKGLVGFYATNRGGTITVKGETFKSFVLALDDFLGILSHYNYVLRTATGQVWGTKEAFENAYEFMSQLNKAPSSNAVLVEIAPGN